MNIKFCFTTLLLILVSVNSALAEDNSMLTSGIPSAPKDFSSIVCIIIKLALDFIPLLVVIGLGAFLQGLIKYVGNGDNEEKRSEGRNMMIYGIIGFFFMVSVWGMLALFTQSFGLALVIPQFQSDTNFANTCNS